ncbi:regulator of chromosome condensation 1/beta-lactamase-inhibitor protein II [Crepidotus variabilis]|uniref:Regulator of chromosome condensation 1/beta-lactamase-inhibitor protein II n=1 Tax=Crepidotus variabilis TaxID=179855 RepID=A0A9P6JUW7_9AGAR|nr:regulator of chromosome condensation 1/beta-lactamase-inhibitor protein II [Crepidotus variabilis]
MPPRRSARAASAQPVLAVRPASKSAASKAKSKSQVNGTSNKRAASPERAESPPPAKRARSETRKVEPAPKARSKPPSRTASKKALETSTKKAVKAKAKELSPVREDEPAPAAAAPPPKPKPKPKPEPQQVQPYFNPLPTPPQSQSPGCLPFVWGAGNFGQFGLGPDVLAELQKPKRHIWFENKMNEGALGEGEGAGIEYIAAGGLHTVFIDEKGTVWTCGTNDNAALGRVTDDVPDPENPGSFLSVDDLTAYPHPLQTLVDEGFRAVKAVAGDSICAAISDKGEFRVWGTFRADEGLLGFSGDLKKEYHPISILQLSNKPGDYEKVSSVAAGSNHLVVLTTHGNIYTWGAGEQGQLGRKVLERRKIHGTHPEKVTLATRGRKAVVVGAGQNHSFAVDHEGDVWAWGLNSMGQTGTGWSSEDDNIVLLPTKVEKLSKSKLQGDVVIQIVGGAHHTIFLTQAGKVYACGRSNVGQLGLADDDAAFNDRESPDFIGEPTLVTFPDPFDEVIQISSGTHNNAAITRAGALYAWGQGVQSELGLGDEEEVKTPHVVVRKEGGAWFARAVACGGQHTVGLFRKKN